MAAVAALSLAACGGGKSRSAAKASTTTTGAPGTGAATDPNAGTGAAPAPPNGIGSGGGTSGRPNGAANPASAGAANSGTPNPGAAGGPGGASTLRIHLVSDRGVPLPGLTVHLVPLGATGQSGNDGTAVLRVPGGTYDAIVDAGCSPELFVQHPATARVAVPQGQTEDGVLQVAAVRRVAPAKPSDFEGDGTWHVGQAHRVTFATVDRCNGQPARNASLASTRFVPGAGWKLAGAPAVRTFNDGRGYVDVACTTANADPSLMAVATRDDRDSIDLLAFDVLDRNPPDCQP